MLPLSDEPNMCIGATVDLDIERLVADSAHSLIRIAS